MIFIIPCLYRLYKVCWLGASRQGWWKWGLVVHPFRFGEHIQWPMAMFSFICQRVCNLSVCFLKTWILLLNSHPYGPNFLAKVYTGYFTVRPVKWRMWSWRQWPGNPQAFTQSIRSALGFRNWYLVAAPASIDTHGCTHSLLKLHRQKANPWY